MATLTQVRETTRFLDADSRSRMLAAQAAQMMPDGITRETIRRQPYAPAMAPAHGSVLVDVDGDERTDLLFNHTALIHGHGHGPVVEAVAAQAGRLEAMPFPNDACLDLPRHIGIIGLVMNDDHRDTSAPAGRSPGPSPHSPPTWMIPVTADG